MKKTVKVLAIITMLGLFCSCGAEKNMADITQMQPELSQRKQSVNWQLWNVIIIMWRSIIRRMPLGIFCGRKTGGFGSVMTELLRLELIPRSLGWK